MYSLGIYRLNSSQLYQNLCLEMFIAETMSSFFIKVFHLLFHPPTDYLPLSLFKLFFRGHPFHSDWEQFILQSTANDHQEQFQFSIHSQRQMVSRKLLFFFRSFVNKFLVRQKMQFELKLEKFSTQNTIFPKKFASHE